MEKRLYDNLLNSFDYQKELASMAKRIISKAKIAPNEATIENYFDSELFAFFRSNFTLYGVEFSPVKEKTLDTRRVLKGRADSAINNFVIEYKQPKTLKSKKLQNKALNQIEDYLRVIGQESSNTTVGMITDGVICSFVSYIDGNFINEDFRELSGVELDRIIRIIIDVNLSALNSTNLVNTLCNPPLNDGTGFNLARVLFSAARQNLQPKTNMLFGEWKELFKLSAHDSQSKQQAIEDRKRSLENIFNVSFKDNNDEYMALFCLQTAYAIIVKCLAFKILSKERLKKDLLIFSDVLHLKSEELREQLKNIEEGTLFSKYGMLNLLEGDFFSWYTNKEQWTNEIYVAIHELYSALGRFTSSSFIKSSNKCHDFFKELYESMIPAHVRHSLGEYYTKKWLAKCVVDEVVPQLHKNWRALDPCCGSGTFITVLIEKVLSETKDLSKEERLTAVLDRVKGIDLNPIAVLSAKVNYFINISELLDINSDIEIPIYLGDSSYVPKEEKINDVTCIKYSISTLKNPISIIVPKSLLKDARLFARTINDIEFDIKMLDYVAVRDKLIALCDTKDINEATKASIELLAKQMVELERKKWNGVWAKIIANYLNTINLGRFDLVVGNPPWVDWKSLPSGYRERIKGLCISRRLFSGDVITGGISLNICALITNVVANQWLSETGIMGFLMPEPLIFQQSYEGFRNLYLGDTERLYINKLVNWNMAGHPFAPVQQKFLTYYISRKVEDYSQGIPVKFMIKKTKKNIDGCEDLDIDLCFETKEYVAGTCSTDRNNFTYAKSRINLEGYKTIAALSDTYIGREGIEFYPQELIVFQKSALPDRNELISLDNIQNPKSKYKVERRSELLEKKMLRPMIKGKNITPFHFEYEGHIVPFPYEKTNPKIPISIDRLRSSAPELAKFYLNNRNLFEAQTDYNDTIIGNKEAGFYALARVGAYSFGTHMVAFRDNSVWGAAVVSKVATDWGGDVLPVFQNHAVYISSDSDGNYLTKQEAHYICGIMNSSIVNDYMLLSSDSRSFPIRLRFRIPKFDSSNAVHKKIANLSINAHKRYDDTKYIDGLKEKLTALYLSIL